MTDHLVDPEAIIAAPGENVLPKRPITAPTDRWARWRATVRPLLGPVYREALAHAEAIHARDVLDVGCGGGELARFLAAADARRRVEAIDPTAATVERAVALTAQAGGAVAHNRPRFRVGEAEHLPFEANSFDLVTSTLALHRCRNAQQALAEFRRVLRPRGRLVLIDPAADHWMMRLYGAWPAPPPRHTRAEMREMLEGVGLAPIEARFLRGFLALYVATY